MILSKSLKGSLLIGLLSATTARGEDVDLEKAIGSLIDAEKNYNKLAQEKDFARHPSRFLPTMASSLRQNR